MLGGRIFLCMRPANERRRYNVMSSLIGWAHAQNDPCESDRVQPSPRSNFCDIEMEWRKINRIIITGVLKTVNSDSLQALQWQ